MKVRSEFKGSIVFAFCFLFSSFGWVNAQDTLINDGELHLIEYSGTSQDFVIPDDPAIVQLELVAKGGDGGFARVDDACLSEGGEGATVSILVDIGEGINEIPRGSTIRFIVGGAGEKGTGGSVLGTGFSYGGGGGGTGILYKTSEGNAWIVLSASGGGGGAYQGRAVGFCVNNNPGEGGRSEITGGDGGGGLGSGDGGAEGQGGIRGVELSGGGGGAFSEGTGITCVEVIGSNEAGEGQFGFPAGGNGGASEGCVSFTFRDGGFGFGGGGAGIGAGGGGGGYSGGGGGGTTGPGGGGGSYVGGLAVESTVTSGETTDATEDGFATYRFIRETIPVAQCVEVAPTVLLDDSGMATIDPSLIDAGSFDPDGSDFTLSVSPDTFDCTKIGPSAVTLTITDSNGQSDQCTTTITITDLTPPNLGCPTFLEVGTDPGACGANVAFLDLVSASDNCNVTVSPFQQSGDFFSAGTTVITVLATDDSGNSEFCSFELTVVDQEAPVVSCPEAIIVPNDAGSCGANVSFTDQISITDNCDFTFTTSHNSGDFFDAGDTEVTVSAVDGSGNESGCSFTVSVLDSEAPSLSCPEAITADNAPGECGVTVEFTDQIASGDNCGTALSFSHGSGNFFDVGTTEVTVTSADDANNSTSCSFTITVFDKEAPVINCPEDVVVTCDTSALTGTGLAFVSDNCTDSPLMIYSDEIVGGDCRWGCLIERTWTVEDPSGNTNTCVQFIEKQPLDLVSEALSIDEDEDGSGDPITLGFSRHTLTITAEGTDCVTGWYPRPEVEGESSSLRRGNQTLNPEDCSLGTNEIDENGHPVNPLIPEAFLLAVKLRLDPLLAELLLSDVDCEIPSILLQAMSSEATLGELMTVTNYALGNLVYVSHRDLLTESLECINSQVDLCTPAEELLSDGGNLAQPIAGNNDQSQHPGQFAPDAGLRLYPNPAASEAFFEWPSVAGRSASVRIYNLQGQLVDEYNIGGMPAGPYRLDLSNFPEGVYQVAVFIPGNPVKTGKLIISR